MRVLVLCLFLVSLGATAKKDYTGYKVLQVTPSTELQLSYLRHLERNQDEALHLVRRPSIRDRAVELVVAPHFYSNATHMLTTRGMHTTVIVSCLQKYFDEEERVHNDRVAERKLQGVEFAFDVYHTLDEMYSYYDELSASNDDVTVTTVGASLEGREIKMISVGSGAEADQFFDCGIHAAEWLAHAVCLWMLNELATGTDAETIKMRESYNFHMIIPVNPDGYIYTWTQDRMWRKNRRDNAGSECWGVDLNRNFDSHHCEEASSDPCSYSYCGPSPFSESESSATRDAIMTLNNPVFSWSVHTAGEMWMYPYGFTTGPTADYDRMEAEAKAGTEALNAVHGQHYIHGQVSVIISLASGCTMDYYYDKIGVEHPAAFELRTPYSDPPETLIVPNSEEVWAGIKTASFMALKK